MRIHLSHGNPGIYADHRPWRSHPAKVKQQFDVILANVPTSPAPTPAALLYSTCSKRVARLRLTVRRPSALRSSTSVSGPPGR